MTASNSALHVDHSHYAAIAVGGSDRVRFVQGMLTGNVETLAVGDWLRAAILNIKGRVVSVVEVLRRDDDLVLVCEPVLGDKTVDILEKHAIIDDVTFAAIEGPMSRVWATAADVWRAGVAFEPAAQPVASSEAVEIRRIEAGLPLYGVDVTEDHFPFESGLADYVDYQKGCYIGQEPIARVHARGSGQKLLRGLIVSGDGAVAVGDPVSHPDRPNAGAITSACVSPELGSIALAYIHKNVYEPGTEVTVGDRAATVVALPFGAK